MVDIIERLARHIRVSSIAGDMQRAGNAERGGICPHQRSLTCLRTYGAVSNSISSGVGDGSGIIDGESVRPKGEGVEADR